MSASHRFVLAIVLFGSCSVLLGAAGPYHVRISPHICGWNLVPTPPAAGGATFDASSATSANDIWVVGSQQGGAATLIEHFDGSQWVIVPSPNVGASSNVLLGTAAITASDAWAVGESSTGQSGPTALTEHFDGHAWTVVAAANPVGIQFSGVTMLAHNDVWAVGIQCCASGFRPAVEHFNGVRWYSHYIGQPGDFPQLVAISGDSSSDVWAVGDTNMLNNRHVGKDVTLVEHWDGSKWRRTPTVDPDDVNRFLSVKANAPNDVWAVGYGYNNADRRFLHALVEHYDGTRWSIVANPAGRGPQSLLYSISSLGPNDAWAVGEIDTEHPVLTEHWDGATWSSVYAPGSIALTAVVDLGADDVWGFGASNGEGLVAENYCIPTQNGDERLKAYRIPPLNGQKSDPREIAIDLKNTAWFSDNRNSAIGHIDRQGHIVEYPLVGAEPLGITLGPDGNMWAADTQGRIAKIAPNGSISEIQLPFGACPLYITSASDGALWFTDCQSSSLGRMTTSGVFTSYSIPFVASHIAGSPDGTVWFTNAFDNNMIGRYSISTGTTQTYLVSDRNPEATGIAIAGDQSAWIAEANVGKITRISTSGVITEFPVPNGAGPYDITLGGDGNMWFTNLFGDQVGSITPDGTFSIYIPRNGPNRLYGIAGRAGDNSIWFVENATARIGRVADIN